MKNEKIKTLLLVEDEMSAAHSRIMMLEKNGYKVKHVQSGESALELITNDYPIDLILFDIELLEAMNSTETAEQILNIKHLPLVFLSSYSESEMAEKVKGIKRYGYVVKNSGAYMLISSLEMALELFEAYRIIEEKIKILDEKEKIFAKIFHTNPVLLSVSTIEDGLFKEVNETFLNTLGYNREEIIGKKSTDLNLWADDRDRAIAVSLLKKQGYLRHFETKIITKNGGERYGLFSVDFIEMNGENCMLSAMTDITDNKIAQEAVRFSHENFKTAMQTLEDIINSIPSGLFIYQYVKPDKLYLIKANSEAEKMTGICAEEWTNKEFNEIWPSAAEAGITKRYLDVIHTGINIELEDAIYTDDRVSGAFRIRAFNIPGNKLGIAFENITKIKQAETALQESESHYHLLADHMSDAVWLMDMNLNTTYCSPSVVKLRGFTAEEIMKFPINKNVTEDSFNKAITLFNEEMVKVNADPFYSFVITIELEYIRKDGSTFWGDSTFTLIRGKDGKAESILGEARDITERKLAEDKINKLLKEKEILLKEVHHRIKNNMHTIASLLYLQADSLNDHSAVTALTDAYNRVNSMMLIYEKLYKSSDFREINADIYLSDLIESITSTINTSSNIEIISRIENCPINTSLLFPVGIIINELLSNSFKYAFPDMRTGKIVISLINNNGIIEINFSDNGIGIPDEVINLDSKGFGINLVKILVEQINGNIEIKGENGAEYKISFPL
jgi:PAS domain S-box-containing protein